MPRGRLERGLAWLALALIAASIQGDLLLDPLDPDPAKAQARYLLLAPFNLGLMLLATVVLRRSGSAPVELRRGVRLLALGLVGWALGNWAWLGYNLAGEDVPYPSLADVGYLSLTALAITALAGMFFRQRRRLGGLDLAIAVAMPITVGALFYILLIAERIAPGDALLTQALNVAYPASDAVFVALAGLILLFTPRSAAAASVRRIAAGLVAFAATDTLFVVGADRGFYFTGSWIDIGYFLALGAIAWPLYRVVTPAGPGRSQLPRRAARLGRRVAAWSAASLKTKLLIAVVLCLVLVDTVGFAVARGTLDDAASARFVGLATAAFAVTGALVLWIVARSLEPLGKITEAARRLGRGEEELGLEVASEDEMQVLADALNQSARALGEARRQQEAQFRMFVQTEKMATMGTLAAGVAHEVNNPLAYILANEEMACDDMQHLADDPAVPERARALARESVESLQLNLRGLRHIGSIVASLRALSRPSAAQREAVDLAATARHVLVLAGDRAQKRGVALTGSIPDGLVAQAAQQEVGQVLLNLVLNALDAAGDAGKVDLRGEVSDENVVFQVSDSGPGIPPEVRAKLFTPFFTTKVDGVGLGLSISQKIAREHGGSLTFTTAPGEGTVFTLRLPRTASAAPVAEAPPAPAAAARGAVPPAATF